MPQLRQMLHHCHKLTCFALNVAPLPLNVAPLSLNIVSLPLNVAKYSPGKCHILTLNVAQGFLELTVTPSPLNVERCFSQIKLKPAIRITSLTYCIASNVHRVLLKPLSNTQEAVSNINFKYNSLLCE